MIIVGMPEGHPNWAYPAIFTIGGLAALGYVIFCLWWYSRPNKETRSQRQNHQRGV